MGRPLDNNLTVRLLDTAWWIIGERSFAALNTEQLATQAGVGTSAIRRRWSTMDALVAEAIGCRQLVDPPEDRGSLRANLIELLGPWKVSTTRDERAVAGLVSCARENPLIRAALQEVVVEPITSAISIIITWAAVHGTVASAERVRLLLLTIQALWWDRSAWYVRPWTTSEVETLVDAVLVPLVQGTRTDGS